jgi:hypothetical protein
LWQHIMVPQHLFCKYELNFEYITQSSAPDDGHMVTRNMLSNY